MLELAPMYVLSLSGYSMLSQGSLPTTFRLWPFSMCLGDGKMARALHMQDKGSLTDNVTVPLMKGDVKKKG